MCYGAKRLIGRDCYVVTLRGRGLVSINSRVCGRKRQSNAAVALVATRYVGAEPAEIAHIVVAQGAASISKGGGGNTRKPEGRRRARFRELWLGKPAVLACFRGLLAAEAALLGTDRHPRVASRRIVRWGRQIRHG